jgi:succinylglutamate desuccinylase
MYFFPQVISGFKTRYCHPKMNRYFWIHVNFMCCCSREKEIYKLINKNNTKGRFAAGRVTGILNLLFIADILSAVERIDANDATTIPILDGMCTFVRSFNLEISAFFTKITGRMGYFGWCLS